MQRRPQPISEWRAADWKIAAEDLLVRYLKRERAEAQVELEKLGYPEEAWRVLKADLVGWRASAALGRAVRRGLPPRERQADQSVTFTFDANKATASLGPQFSVIRKPEALKGQLTWREDTRAWYLAKRAAVAAAALRWLKDPVAMFAAGQFLMWQDLLRRFPKLRKEATEAGLAPFSAGRAKGGPAAAAARHKKHVETKVTPLRDEYMTHLRDARRKYPRESPAALSPKIIKDMAKEHDARGLAKNRACAVKRMRDIIKPRALQKNVP